ncbi:MAG: nodulation protein NfeD [Gammaproteobacteria bacterium]|nr:nodulation protein NfeD [Gammaproteobacteria bacterium]MCW5582544.1 nodulation protein NfeD [Gammaproteobacteria bacterium]
MRKWTELFGILLFLLMVPLVAAAEKVIVLDLTGPIGPATQDYVNRGITYAEREGAAAIILQLNTPGGLESSMRGISEAIHASSVPVIAYVYPSGARAASAGLFIMYASHLAAMAPGTNIGAASPVNLLESYQPTDTKEVTTKEKKIMNDAAAYIRSLAQLHGRNADWAESAVRQAASISANEAKELHVINEIADNYPQLLQKMDGHTITIKGTTEKINIKDAKLENIPQDWRYQFLSFITNPNIAYILMLITIYGIFFELSNPGLVLPGVMGVISLLLVLYAFQLMPINYAGLLLVLIGIGFMMLEVYMASFGIIGIGGIIAFIIGSIMLFDTYDANYQLHWALIITTSVISIAFFFMIFNLMIKSHKNKIITGQEGLIGSTGVILSKKDNDIVVRVLGEIWNAKSSYALHPGDTVRVTQIQGLVLIVEPLEKHQHS